MDKNNKKNNITLMVEENKTPILKEDACASYLIEHLREQKKAEIEKVDLSILNEKKLLSVEEAAELFGIGRSKIRELTNDRDCPFVLWIGGHRKIKRAQFEEFIMKQYSV